MPILRDADQICECCKPGKSHHQTGHQYEQFILTFDNPESVN